MMISPTLSYASLPLALPLAQRVSLPSYLAKPLRHKKPYGGLMVSASYNVAVLGTNPLVELLLTRVPTIAKLHIYRDVKLVSLAAEPEISDGTSCAVSHFYGPAALGDSLNDVDMVLISRPKLVHAKAISPTDTFTFNANWVKLMVESVAAHCPKSLVLIVNDQLLSSMVPLAAEALKQNGVYDPKKLFGVTTLDVSVAKAFARRQLQSNKVELPVIGGHGGRTTLPLLSKTKPCLNFTEEQLENLTVTIRNAISLFLLPGPTSFSHQLQMAQAVESFVRSLLRALDGEVVYESAFVATSISGLPPFFALRARLGKSGVEAFIDDDLRYLSRFEEKELEDIKLQIKSNIDKGVRFATN